MNFMKAVFFTLFILNYLLCFCATQEEENASTTTENSNNIEITTLTDFNPIPQYDTNGQIFIPVKVLYEDNTEKLFTTTVSEAESTTTIPESNQIKNFENEILETVTSKLDLTTLKEELKENIIEVNKQIEENVVRVNEILISTEHPQNSYNHSENTNNNSGNISNEIYKVLPIIKEITSTERIAIVTPSPIIVQSNTKNLLNSVESETESNQIISTTTTLNDQLNSTEYPILSHTLELINNQIPATTIPNILEISTLNYSDSNFKLTNSEEKVDEINRSVINIEKPMTNEHYINYSTSAIRVSVNRNQPINTIPAIISNNLQLLTTNPNNLQITINNIESENQSSTIGPVTILNNLPVQNIGSNSVQSSITYNLNTEKNISETQTTAVPNILENTNPNIIETTTISSILNDNQNISEDVITRLHLVNVTVNNSESTNNVNAPNIIFYPTPATFIFNQTTPTHTTTNILTPVKFLAPIRRHLEFGHSIIVKGITGGEHSYGPSINLMNGNCHWNERHDCDLILNIYVNLTNSIDQVQRSYYNSTIRKYHEIETYGGAPFEPYTDFEIEIIARTDLFEIKINRRYFCSFTYKMSLALANHILISTGGDIYFVRIEYLKKTEDGIERPIGGEVLINSLEEDYR